MPTAAPQSVITKYALVRAPRVSSQERLATVFITKPDKKTSFWIDLQATLASNKTSSDTIGVAKSLLGRSAVSAVALGGKPVLDLVSDDGGVVAKAQASGSLSVLAGMKTKYSQYFQGAAAATTEDVVLGLWDQFAARMVTSSEFDVIQQIVGALKILHIAKHLSTAASDEDIDEAVLQAEVLLPKDVEDFIAKADETRLKEIADAKKKDAEERLGRVASLVRKSVLAGATRHFLQTAMDAKEVNAPQPGSITNTTDGTTNTGLASLAGESGPVSLTPAALGRMPTAVKEYLTNDLGVAALEQMDILDVLSLTGNDLYAVQVGVVASLPLSQVVEVGQELDRAGRVVSSVAKTDVNAVVSALVSRYSLAGTPALQPTGGTIPVGPSKIEPAGYGDLKIVRQQLQKYELGEIAHIENVLAGEERERTHSRLDRTEQQLVLEVEQVTESEKDLQTTERFELSQEIESLRKESSSSEAGVTVTGTYGPVSISANAKTQSNESAEQAQKSAQSYMRETVAKAVERVQKKTRQQQTITVTSEVTENNRHKFSATQSSVVGVYRYVEKHYWCQTLNYGARLMMEFWIPEPAAFYKYSQSVSPRSEGHLIAPEEPNISPASITDSTYQALAAKYKAEVSEPPKQYQYSTPINIRAKEQDTGGEVGKFATPEGYEIINGVAQAQWIHVVGQPNSIAVFAGGDVAWYSSSWTWRQWFVKPVRGTFPIRVQPFQVSDWTIGITFLMQRTKESYEAWQLATYNSIMQAYRLAKDDYDKKVNAARTSEHKITLRSENEYRTVERQELRRAALELMTDQHFQTFGSVQPVGGYPTIDNNSAISEGALVRFFEHAFEWENIVYVFYPYFWARRTEWPQYLSLTDIDPVFSRFLGAGYARVVVPVRKNYENHVSIYMTTGVILPDGNAPLSGDPRYVSIVDEIKQNDTALASNSDQDGIPEGQPWRVVLPTPLVCLDSDKVKLPSWELKPPGKPIPYRPSEALCDGVPYNIDQWPNATSIAAELKNLGYDATYTGSADAFLASKAGRRLVRVFQQRANQVGASVVLGRPLRVDGLIGPCTLRVLTVTIEMRLRGEWPGPGVP